MILGRFALESFTIIGTFIAFYLHDKNGRFYLRELNENRYLYVALAFLIPIGIALIDSLDPKMSLSVFGRMVRYLFIGVLAVAMAQYEDNYRKLELISFIALMLVCLDAIMQWLTGYHIHGYNPVVGNRVMGVFYDKAHLSYFLGTFAPIVFFFLYQKIEDRITALRIIGVFIAILLLVTGVFIGGARAGMIALFSSISLFVIFLFFKGKIKYKLRFLGILLIIMFLTIILVSQLDIVQSRFTTSIAALGTEDFLDRFTSARTQLWYVGFNEVPNYWLNGVGPRGFDKLFTNYPDIHSHFSGYVWQPHLHGLEVLIETGVIGFIPYLLVLLYLFIRMFTARAGNVWLMMGFVAMMPINSHMGLYEGYWMTLIWIPIMIGLAQAYQADKSVRH